MKLVSGGQTGADRAALEVAREIGLETRGWAPKGWMTENGPDPSLADFGLKEHQSEGYPARTIANVVDSDATIIFGTWSPGSDLTAKMARSLKRPCLNNPAAAELRAFLAKHDVKVLNVAGNRASTNPGIAEHVKKVLREALA